MLNPGNIFLEAKSQYIDNNGKTRMLNFKYKGAQLSLITSPVPPLDLPINDKIVDVPIDTALNFIKHHKLELKQKELAADDVPRETHSAVKGLWVETRDENSGIYYGYIPISSSGKISDLPTVIQKLDSAEPTKNDPLRVPHPRGNSKLQKYRSNKKIADFLKIYTLYTYSLELEKFSKKSFIVIENYKYDIEKLNKKLIAGNDVMYAKGKLIVPSAETITKLMGYLKISLANNRPDVLKLATATSIEDYYQSISDFRPATNQLIFTSSNGVLRWKREMARVENRNTVSQNLQPQYIYPYFYKTPKIRNNSLHIIQNVENGSLENAVIVSYQWVKSKVNVGYLPTDTLALPPIEEISYSAYTNNGILSTSRGKGKTNDISASVIFYEDGTYGAILFLG